MLLIYDDAHANKKAITKYTDLVITKEINIDDILSVNITVVDARLIKKEYYIQTSENTYVIKEINDIDNDWCNVIAKLNTEELKGHAIDSFINYSYDEILHTWDIRTLPQTMDSLIGLTSAWDNPWTWNNQLPVGFIKERIIDQQYKTWHEVLQNIQTVFMVEMTIDTTNRVINVYETVGSDKGVYFAEQLNLKKLDVQGNSYDLITKMIPLGIADEITGVRLDITSVEPLGLDYITNNQYTDKVLANYWIDDSYVSAQSLYDDAVAKLEILSVPYESYKIDIYYLSNQAKYEVLDYDLGDTVTILSNNKQVKTKQRMVKMYDHPDEPEKNSGEIANITLRLENIIDIQQNWDLKQY